MTMTLDTARAQADRARTALDTALLTGADTTAPRASYRQALARLAELERPTDAPAPLPTSTPDPAEAEALLAPAQAELSAFATALAAVSPVTVQLDPALARAVVEARHAAEADSDATTAHQARIQALADRIHALEHRRAEIVARRARAETRADDAGQLELIAADLEGLEAMLARARAEAPPTRASARVRAAEAAWTAHVADTRARLAAHVIESLQDALLRAVPEAQRLPFGARPAVARELVQYATTGAGKW